MACLIDHFGVAIKFLDDTPHYFETKKGMGYWDCLSLMLFHNVIDMLTILIERAMYGEISGVVPHLVYTCPSYNTLMMQSYTWNMTFERLKNSS